MGVSGSTEVSGRRVQALGVWDQWEEVGQREGGAVGQREVGQWKESGVVRGGWYSSRSECHVVILLFHPLN